ncbi:MAG: glycerol kinase, partial [Clostridiales bacterium]|nr:glycerol kinase [Clostridiales bacterium]
LAALAGDQHAALFGQGCFEPGMAKNTYGTGCFLLMNTGNAALTSMNRLLTTVAWRVGGQTTYALEGSVFVAGAAVQWLRDEMGLIATAAESETLARSIDGNAGVYMVPAFSGLGAPYWDMYGRGLIVGLTRGTGRAHVVRAALEAIAYQTRDVLEEMVRDSGMRPSVLRVDGGASANRFLMQFQADVLGTTVCRMAMLESTALGAAMLAGLATGIWTDRELRAMRGEEIAFEPAMAEAAREALYRDWRRAVNRAMGWAHP